MTVFVQEELMSLGDFSVTFDYRSDILAELVDEYGRPRKVHALVYDADDNLVAPPFVLLRAEGDETGFVIGGRNLLWWLGVGDDGPIIEDREYISGSNRLSNPSFELATFGLYWSVKDETLWVVPGGTPYSGIHAALMSGNATADDVLASSEAFETRPGHQWTADMRAFRLAGNALGRLRLRTVYHGIFHTPNLITNGDFALGSGDSWLGGGGTLSIISSPGNAYSGNNVLRVGPSAYLQRLPNSSFEDGLTGWNQAFGTWAQDNTWAIEGTYSVGTEGSGTVLKRLQSDAIPGGATDAYPMIPGDQYRLEVVMRVSSDVDLDSHCYIAIYWHSPDPTKQTRSVVAEVSAEAIEAGNARASSTHVTVPDGVESCGVAIDVRDHTVGKWNFDAIRLTRFRGNRDQITHQHWPITAERRYQFTAMIRSGPAIFMGEVWPVFYFARPGYPDIVEEGPHYRASRDPQSLLWTRYATDVTPPSGTETMGFAWRAEDVYGDYIWIDNNELRDTDNTTKVFDQLTAETAATWINPSRTTTAPTGAERVHVEVVAERISAGWTVDEVRLRRTGVAQATGNQIVTALLKDPDTNAQLPILAGNLHNPEVIPYDWWIRNLTNRAALDHYHNVVADPPREYRLDTDRTLDSGPPEVIFNDHTPTGANSVVLLTDDIDVAPLPSVEVNVEERVTKIRLLGAERRSTTGERILLQTSAAVAGSNERDWNNQPVNRTRLVSDSTVDHIRYAQAVADDLAAKEAEPALALEATLTGTDRVDNFNVGDWIYVYKPESGIEDLSNPVIIEGEAVFPRRVRVLGRTRRLGPSHRIVIRRANGTTFDLPGVRWEDSDTTSLTIGDRRPAWKADPQSGAPGGDYLRFRASAPR